MDTIIDHWYLKNLNITLTEKQGEDIANLVSETRNGVHLIKKNSKSIKLLRQYAKVPLTEIESKFAVSEIYNYIVGKGSLYYR